MSNGFVGQMQDMISKSPRYSSVILESRSTKIRLHLFQWSKLIAFLNEPCFLMINQSLYQEFSDNYKTLQCCFHGSRLSFCVKMFLFLIYSIRQRDRVRIQIYRRNFRLLWNVLEISKLWSYWNLNWRWTENSLNLSKNEKISSIHCFGKELIFLLISIEFQMKQQQKFQATKMCLFLCVCVQTIQKHVALSLLFLLFPLRIQSPFLLIMNMHWKQNVERIF